MWRVLARDAGLRLLSLLVAAVAWLWVQGQQTRSERVRVDLEFVVADNLVASETLQSTATAVVEGPLSAIRRAQIYRPTLRLDLGKERAGTHEVPLTEGTLDGMPAVLRVTGWVPDAVRVRLETRARRSVPVEAQWAGEPAAGGTVGKVRVTPEVVEVTGPRAVVQELESVKTRPIDLAGWTASSEVPVELDLPRGVEPTAPWAGAAAVEIDTPRAEATFSGVAVVVRGSGEWRPAPGAESLQVTLEGPTRLLRAIRSDRIVAMVEVPSSTSATTLSAAFQAERVPRYELVFPREDAVRVAEPPPAIPLVRAR